MPKTTQKFHVPVQVGSIIHPIILVNVDVTVKNNDNIAASIILVVIHVVNGAALNGSVHEEEDGSGRGGKKCAGYADLCEASHQDLTRPATPYLCSKTSRGRTHSSFGYVC